MCNCGSWNLHTWKLYNLRHLMWDVGEERELEVRGLFYGIGHTPNSDLVKDQVELDEKGYVKVRPSSVPVPASLLLPVRSVQQIIEALLSDKTTGMGQPDDY